MKFHNITTSKYQYKDRLIEIFWATSVKRKGTFTSQIKENNFRKLYFDDYFDNGSVYIILKNNDVLGYLLIVDDTKLSLIKNKELSGIYSEFLSELDEYPASLHININPSYQGMGVGSNLIESAIEEKKKSNKNYNIHLITHIDSSNTKFYEKLEFELIKVDHLGRAFYARS